MIFDVRIILLLSLFSPVAEAFPNLYMSWWIPSNGKIRKYLDTWPRRVLVVLVVWIPILITLATIIDSPVLIWTLATLVLTAFGLRLYALDRSLSQTLKGTRRKIKLLKIPDLLYFLALSSMGAVLYMAVPDSKWLVPLAITIIFLGAFIIATFRQGKRTNLALDVVGRLIFILGFLLNLHNLIRAASPVILG